MTPAPWFRYRCKPLFLCPTLIVAVLSMFSGANAQQPIFPVTSFYNPPTPASTFVTGDLNGDGQPDIAFVSPGASAGQFATLTVLLNGASAPTPIVTSSLNCTSIPQVLAADVNNDKKLDLILTCAGYVVVLFGDGDGTFQPPVYYAVTGTPIIGQPVDLNGDGFLDIIASTPTAALIMLNRGAANPGSLLPVTSYPVPPGLNLSLAGIQGGDFNGDGKQDLIAVNTNTSQSIPFVIFNGNGDGTFQTAQTPNQVPATGPFVVADFNHDGISDVAYLSPGSITGAQQSVQLLLGNSNGKFTNTGAVSLTGFTNYTNLVYAGLTNIAGTIDLAIVGSNTTIIRSNGIGGLSLGPSYAIAGTPLPETDSNGATNLLFLTTSGFSLLPGNGDGTFQGLPSLQVGSSGFVAIDLNGDGLTDVLSLNPQITGNPGLAITSAIGRGDGTLLVTHQTSTTSIASTFLLAADFNGDGKIDAATFQSSIASSAPSVAIYTGNGDGSFQSATVTNLPPGNPLHAITGDFNGDGHLDLIIATYSTVPSQGQSNQTLVFLPGNGNNTFGAPVTVATLTSFNKPSSVYAADLNHDGKLDLVWNSSVYLGKGDGTFTEQPLSVVDTPSTSGGFNGPLAIGDLNGDGIPDIVVQPPSIAGSTPGFAVYAGIGDGTFQTTPLFSQATLPQSTRVLAALIGDVNADGNPDLLVETQDPNSGDAIVSVYLGDGKGNLITDPNIYPAGHNTQDPSIVPSPIATFARLNNRAPALPGDNALDFLTFTSGGATTLLNQLNRTPTTPPLLSSTITISSSSITAAPTQAITFTAFVKGVSPSGIVTLTSNGATLATASVSNVAGSNSTSTLINAPFSAEGTYTVSASYSGDTNNQPSSSAPITITIAKVPSSETITTDTQIAANRVFHFIVNLMGFGPSGPVTLSLADGTIIGTAQAVNGQASLGYFFPTAGTYTVYANYAGDAANLPSTSSAFTFTVMAQDFTLTTSGNYATLTGGQGATGTLTITPENFYSGTVNFSCSQLVAGEACSFTPPSVRSLDGFTQVSSVFVITTTASNSTKLRKFFEPLDGIAFAGLFGMIFFRKRIRRAHGFLLYRSLLALLLTVSILQIAACSSSPSSGQPDPNAGTPKGTHTFIITAADSAGGPSHTVSITLVVD